MATNNLIHAANVKFRSKEYLEAIALYEQALAAGYPAILINENLRLCRRRIAAACNVAGETMSRPSMLEPLQPDDRKCLAKSPQVTVTLTTISSRLAKIDKVLETLHNQNLPPIRILLNLSHEPYLLDEGVAKDDPNIQALYRFPLVKINWVTNTGPYRKIVPFLNDHFSSTVTEDKLFITVDDDTLYPPDFVETLVEQYMVHDCVIAFRGRYMEDNSKELLPYANWTWGRNERSMRNLPTGKDGVLYSTKFFTREFLEMDNAISMAPTADDLWIRWHCGLNGVPAIILNPEACTSDYKSFPVVDYSKEYRAVSLYAMHNSSSSHGRNDSSVKALESHFLKRWGYNMVQLMTNNIAGPQ